MNHIELGEWNAARPHLVHPRLILRAPRISEREPVKRIAQRLEDRLSLARNPRAPIDNRAEYIKEQCFHVIFRFPGAVCAQALNDVINPEPGSWRPLSAL